MHPSYEGGSLRSILTNFAKQIQQISSEICLWMEDVPRDSAWHCSVGSLRITHFKGSIKFWTKNLELSQLLIPGKVFPRSRRNNRGVV